MNTFASVLSIATVAFLVSSRPAGATDPVIVHEWGTFTCLQDEQGNAIGGINVDDEPVPYFVWQYANRMVAAQYSKQQKNLGLPPYNADGGKGWTVGDPTVTMRLETPVIYLYPPKGQSPQSVPPLDVEVDFHGGVLSQYYPYAHTNGADLNGEMPYLQKQGITGALTTGLMWKGVHLGASDELIPTNGKDVQSAPPWLLGRVVDTDDKVWTTPREVSAPLLGVNFSLPNYAHPGTRYDCAQTEHFLFYRGVGHLDSPIFVGAESNGVEGARLICSQKEISILGAAWLVEIRPDGSCAERTLASLRSDRSDLGVNFFQGLSTAFDHSDFSTDNLTKLKASMHNALKKEGLYDDEATAMLKTWELSYFKSPGLRFFYLVPRAWTDKVLLLTITGAATDITRVMVGRIELVTDAQKAALARLATGPCPNLPAIKKAALDAIEKRNLSDAEKLAFYSGEKPLSDLGISIPPLVQDYLSLGRFRDALILHQEHEHPSPMLEKFISGAGF